MLSALTGGVSGGHWHGEVLGRGQVGSVNLCRRRLRSMPVSFAQAMRQTRIPMTKPQQESPTNVQETVTAKNFSISEDTQGTARSGNQIRYAVLTAIIAVLALLTFVVVVLLPRWVALPDERSSVATPEISSSSVPNQSPVVGITDTATSSGEAREDTQERLRAALEKLAMLEALQGDEWAKTELFDIRVRIGEGEKAYRENRYVAAQNIYLETSGRIDALLTQVPDMIVSQLDAGNLAISAGDSSAARSAFETVLKIAPDNSAAAAGLARTATLDQALALVLQAEGYERTKQPAEAARTYREALKMDPLLTTADAAVQRIERDQRQRAFQSAMSDGLRALDDDRFSVAREAFSRADALDPGRVEVRAAQRELENRATSFHVERHITAARSAESAERWDAAHQHYSAALKRDARLSSAVEGQTRAALRRRIDARMLAYLQSPERLVDANVQTEAMQALADARALQAAGRRITAQIDSLAHSIQLARTPQEVALHSDGNTLVSIIRVGRLGAFVEHALKLLPGNYTALGQRDGYRDVRVEFVVEHGVTVPIVTVKCSEKFSFDS